MGTITTQADPETIGDLRNWQRGTELAKPGLIRRLMSAIGTAARFMQHFATRKPAPNPWDEVAALEKELRGKVADRENEPEPENPLSGYACAPLWGLPSVRRERTLHPLLSPA